MTILGADPDQLESTAQRVHALGDNYENANQQIGYWLRRMAWEGPEADRFHALYQSQMRPQLLETASYMREASTFLRAQAADQIRASRAIGAAVCGAPVLPGTNWFDPFGIRDDIGDALKDGYDALITVLNPLSLIQHIDEYWLDGGLTKVVNYIRPGLSSPLAKWVSGGFSVLSVVQLPWNIVDFAGDIENVDWQDQDTLVEMMYSGSAVLAGAGSTAVLIGMAMGLATPAAPVVLGVAAALTVGTFVIDNWDTISGELESAGNWLLKNADQIIVPIGPSLPTGPALEFVEAGVDFGGDMIEAGVDFFEDAGDGLRNFGSKVRGLF